MQKRLCKSSSDRAICGVCGGIAQYFEIDSIIIRLLFVLFSLALGSGLLFYIIAALIMPSEEMAAQQAYYEQQRSYQGAPYVSPDGTAYRSATGTGFEARGQRPVEARYTATEAAPDEEYDDVDASTKEMPEDGVVFEDVTPDRKQASEAAPADTAEAAADKDSAPSAAESAAETAAPKAAAGSAAGEGTSQQDRPQYRQTQQGAGPQGSYQYQAQDYPQQPPRGNSGRILGWICLLAGIAIVVQFFVPRIPVRLVFAAFVICLGLVLLLRKK